MSSQIERFAAAGRSWQFKLLRALVLFALAIVVGGAAVRLMTGGVPQAAEDAVVAFLLEQEDVRRSVGPDAEWQDERSGIIRSQNGDEAIATLRGALEGNGRRVAATVRVHLINGQWQVWAGRYREGDGPWWSVGGPALHGAPGQPPAAPSLADTINMIAAREGNDRALARVDAALRGNYDNSDLHVLRGVILRRLRRNGDAEMALRTALRLDPRNSEAAAALAELYHDTSELDKMKVLVEMALESDPTNGHAHWVHARYILATERDGPAYREAVRRACRNGFSLACGVLQR